MLTFDTRHPIVKLLHPVCDLLLDDFHGLSRGSALHHLSLALAQILHLAIDPAGLGGQPGVRVLAQILPSGLPAQTPALQLVVVDVHLADVIVEGTGLCCTASGLAIHPACQRDLVRRQVLPGRQRTDGLLNLHRLPTHASCNLPYQVIQLVRCGANPSRCKIRPP